MSKQSVCRRCDGVHPPDACPVDALERRLAQLRLEHEVRVDAARAQVEKILPELAPPRRSGWVSRFTKRER